MKVMKLGSVLERASLSFDLEADLTSLVSDWLSYQDDIDYYKASDRYQRGISDLILCVRGMFVAIELKGNNYEATPHQKDFIRRMNKVGGTCGEARTLNEVMNIVNIARRKANG